MTVLIVAALFAMYQTESCLDQADSYLESSQELLFTGSCPVATIDATASPITAQPLQKHGDYG